MPKENVAGYIALVHRDKDTSYGASFPDVPAASPRAIRSRKPSLTPPRRWPDILP
ncbi:MAG: hypothetical protein JWQ94_1088 [Tardiphaga sp.]|nr:hypothetical protein [Tardiphaga sp.]